MVVRTLTAAIRETLVDRMIHDIDHPFKICGIPGIGIILRIIVHHLTDETDAHLAEGIVELVIAKQRSTDDRPVWQSLDIIFIIGIVRPFQKSVLDIIVT